MQHSASFFTAISWRDKVPRYIFIGITAYLLMILGSLNLLPADIGSEVAGMMIVFGFIYGFIALQFWSFIANVTGFAKVAGGVVGVAVGLAATAKKKKEG